MKKIVITGADGTLGQEFIEQNKSNNEVLLYPFGRNQLDITNSTHVMATISEIRPTHIFHCAAITDVDWCQLHPTESYEVNVRAVEHVLEAAHYVSATLIFPSSYYIYSGQSHFPVDDRLPVDINLKSIISTYSQQKYQAEQIICNNSYDNYFIIRLGSLFGGYPFDKKFVGKILKVAKTINSIEVIDDIIIQPSYTKDSIVCLNKLIDINKYGTYNMTGHGHTSFYNYAQAVLEYAHLDTVKIIPVPSSRFPTPAPRAKKLLAINGKLKDLGIDVMRNWKVALKEYIHQHFIN